PNLGRMQKKVDQSIQQAAVMTNMSSARLSEPAVPRKEEGAEAPKGEGSPAAAPSEQAPAPSAPANAPAQEPGQGEKPQ
ncbi:MAG TPA: transglycosylase, partial [Geomonas sp.]|nr:transglycosylase [Geomonas sp.]